MTKRVAVLKGGLSSQENVKAFENIDKKYFSTLKSIAIDRSFPWKEAFEQTLVLRYCKSDDHGEGKELELVFYGVRAIDHFDLNDFNVSFLKVTSVSGHQLDGIRYEVKDYEGLFSFLCHSFDITLILEE